MAPARRLCCDSSAASCHRPKARPKCSAGRWKNPCPLLNCALLRQEVGQVLQGLHLVARLSALENVLIGSLGRVTGWRSWTRCYPPPEVASAETSLHAVGLLAHARTRADRLSGGEKQKVAIARLLMQRPRLILADEPTAALDPSAAAEVCHLLVKAARQATLITVVHNPALLPLLAERVIGLRHGRIAFDLPLARVSDQELGDLYRPDGGTEHRLWQAPSSTPSAIRSVAFR
jgi:phosphonate transport system ATP-binding protein